MEGAHDKSMDLKASAEQEVRKLQDMVKKLERQNELLRYTQNGAFTGVAQKRESLDLEDVTLINLNDSADDLEDSWLYESPVKQATPEQKSVSSSKWAKTVIADGLQDDVRKCLIDKLDDIEAQQELSKVRMYQKPESRISSLSKPNDSLFFQPTNRAAVVNRRSSSGQQVNAKQFNSEDNPSESYDLDTSPHGSIEDLDDEPQGPVLRRSALTKESDPKSELQRAKKTSQSGSNSPLETRKLANISPASRRSVSPTPDENLRIQPRSRTPLIAGGDNNAIERDNFETSSQSILDNTDDDIDDRVPVVGRSALALPKPSSEGLSKQLWYSGPISERQKTKADSSTRIGRSVSPGPGSKLQPRSTTGVAVRRSAGSRGSIEDMLDIDDNAPVQRRSLPQIPTDSNGVRSGRLAKSDESMGTRTQLKPRSKAQNLLQPATQSNVVTRRSLLTPPSSGSNSPKNSRSVVARRKAPSQTRDANLDDSWKEGCY